MTTMPAPYAEAAARGGLALIVALGVTQVAGYRAR